MPLGKKKKAEVRLCPFCGSEQVIEREKGLCTCKGCYKEFKCPS